MHRNSYLVQSAVEHELMTAKPAKIQTSFNSSLLNKLHESLLSSGKSSKQQNDTSNWRTEANYQPKSTAQNKSEINSESPFIFFKLRWAGEN